MSRYIEDLHPQVQEAYIKLQSEWLKQGYKFIITSTLRTNEEQNQLYAQGRSKPGNVVTWVKGGGSYHNYGLALDFCPLVDGKCAWNRLDLFDAMGEIAEKFGFEWGGRWKYKDRPHLQMTFGLSIKDLQNGKRLLEPHWADDSYTYLTQNWVDSLEKRYDEPITRGEVFSLLTRILKQLSVFIIERMG